MPRTEVVFYKDDDGSVPVLEWLRPLKQRNNRAFAKCLVRIRRLAQMGHELRRPEADLLRDEIYELRAKQGRVQYRLLYFFHGRTMAVLTHALTKEGEVLDIDIDRAIIRKVRFRKDPEKHTHHGDIDNG